tara:strand:- start:215 stop:1528 length:1314 start_codon:yes stop_codon:yes gene_type:complete
MRINNHYKTISFVLILLSISSFFAGYIRGENSAGAGTLYHDFENVWINLQTFLKNDLLTAIKLTAGADGEVYQSSRTPLIYIFHKLFNPFTENKIFFIRSVFAISLILPIIFYLCLKQKFKKEENLLLILISAIICLSPYFRTSAYWGLEENFSLISLLLTFLFLNQFLHNTERGLKNYYQIFLAVFFSSICLYLDQKLTIIPLICFFHIIFCNRGVKIKIFAVFLYFIFSLPYIYLITIWGNIIPTGDALDRGIGDQLYLQHLGYMSTIMAFYLLPLLFYKKENFLDLLNNFLKERKNYYLLSLFFIYLLYLLIFYDYEAEIIVGKGFIHKIAIVLFEKIYFQKIFIYFSFFISWLIILIYLNGNLKDKLIVFYFFVLSLIIYPIFQEYLDPLIILMAFTFFGSKLFINYKNTIFLFLYLSIFLIFSNIYYNSLVS